MITRSEAIKQLRLLKADITNGLSFVSKTKDKHKALKSLDMAIASMETDEAYVLEYENPDFCKDCISRQVVDDYIARLLSGYLYEEERERLEKFSAWINELPSVLPKADVPETNVGKIGSTIKNDDLTLIHTWGLDEGIRCAMCTNNMKSDRGCDGGCVVNNAMYKKVMDVIENHIVDTNKMVEPTTKNDLGVREFEEIVVEYPPEDLCTYPEYKGKPYFGIKYKENEKEIVGYGTYKPEVLSQYLKNYFISTTKDYLGVDAISRQAINGYIDYILSHGMGKQKSFEFIKKFVANLPPVTPQPKTGHWIEDENEMEVWCSECGEDNDECSKYCPNCGGRHERGEGMTREEAVAVLKAFMENPLFSYEHKAAFNIAIHDIKQRHDWDINKLMLVPKTEWEQDHAILKAYSDGANEVLDKIRAEIKAWYWQADKQALAKDPCVVDAMIDLFIRTIDKYKTESEE